MGVVGVVGGTSFIVEVEVEVEEKFPSRAAMLEEVEEEEEEAEGERPCVWWAGRWGERMARRRLGCMVCLLRGQ